MKRRANTIFSLFLLALSLLIVIIAPSGIAQTEPRFDDPDFDPSEMHRLMAWGKGRGWIDRSIVTKALSVSSVPCTQENYDVKKYDIFINLNDTIQTISGRVTFTAEATQAGVNEVQVDLVHYMNVDSILMSSGPLTFTRDGDVVIVTLDQAYNTGEIFEFDFHYHGQAVWSNLLGGFAFHDRGFGAYCMSSVSEPYGARTWWPCKDRPDDKADTYKICIQVRRDYYASSNGILDSTIIPFGTPFVKRYYYTMPYPMTTYLFFVAAYDYNTWTDEWIYNDGLDTMPLVNAVFPENLQASHDMLPVTSDVLTTFSDLYGLYPFTEAEYGHTTHDWFYAMEHQANTTCWVNEYYNWGFSEPVVAHEAAHQWYGDYLSPHSWSDVWINEAWASYSEALYFQVQTFWDSWPAYHNYMNNMDFADGGTIYKFDTTDPGELMGLIIYDKGAWLCHMQRHVLGDSLFFQGLKDCYNSEYQHDSWNTVQFIDLWEQSTGQELNWFFDQWLYGEYRPHYLWTFLNEPNGENGYTAYVAIDQMQTTDPQVFVMPVEFVIETESGPLDTVTLWIDKRRDMFVFDLPDPMTHLHVDPANWVLNYESEINWKLHFILPSKLPDGSTSQPYDLALEVRGGTEDNSFALIEGTLPSGITMDDQANLSGQPTDTGEYHFTVRVDDNMSNYWDEQEFVIFIDSVLYLPGDMNGSETVDITDLVYLVTYMFSEGPAPWSMNLADVNGSCGLDIVDLVYLVDYMFQSGPAPIMGCIE